MVLQTWDFSIPVTVALFTGSDSGIAVKPAQELRTHVALMDLSMPWSSGIDAKRAIRPKLPAVQVIGPSMFDEAERASIRNREP